MKKALVCGAGGFIGSALVKRLKADGYQVTGADRKNPEFSPTAADEFCICDLRRREDVEEIILLGAFDEVYQLAAEMGGAGFCFTGEHDAEIMRSSALINLNVLHTASVRGVHKIFFSSSACIYPERNQRDPNNPKCDEASAYPAAPDSEYGWEKLFSERLYEAYHRNYGVEVRIARFHNIFGPEGTWKGGREKAPAAICRKVAEAHQTGEIEVWGDGEQTRSFLYIDECVEGIRRLMESPFDEPLNIGSTEMVTINQLVKMVAFAAGKTITIKHVDGPQGVRGRCSDNALVDAALGWKPSQTLAEGLAVTYKWIESQVEAVKAGGVL